MSRKEVQTALATLEDEKYSWEERLSAVRRIGEASSLPRGVVKNLIFALVLAEAQTFPSPIVLRFKKAIIELLRQIGSKDAKRAISAYQVTRDVDTLTNRLSENDWKIRFGSAAVLAEMGADSSSAVPALILCLRDEKKEVRAVAARALGIIGSSAEEAVEPLISALPKEQDSLRDWIVFALREIATARSVEAVRGYPEVDLEKITEDLRSGA